MTYCNNTYDEERALYGVKGATVTNCCFDGPADGESALKEASDLEVDNCFFNLRYPFWHVNNAVIKNSEMTELCRAALWYDEGISLINCKMNGIKALRECSNIELDSCVVNSPEFIWRCKNLKINNTEIVSEYPFFESKEMNINSLKMKGKYSFQYVENTTVENSVLDTKDAFWHSKNVTVKNCVLKGEYLAWYSENLHLINCEIIGTQPLCYCRGLILENCRMTNTDLSFEKSEVKASIIGDIVSVKNPYCGEIYADSIGEVIIDEKWCDPENTKIVIRGAE